MAAATLIVFLKRPRAGGVKTRLASSIGAPLAARLYRVLAAAEVRNTHPAGDGYDRLFAFDPPEALEEMSEWFPGNVWLPQEGDDLGARMANATAAAFERGAERVAIVGSDVPWVSRELVGAAFEALEENDVALGPARDGGYYLIALRAPSPEIFEGIRWSSASVADETLRRIRRHGLRVKILETLPDIDTVEDLAREWPRLERFIDDQTLRTALGAHMRLAREPWRLTLLTKPGCGLCVEMLGVVEPVARDSGLELTRLDITNDAELQALYGYEIPVLLLGGREICRHRVTRDVLLTRLAAPY